jgi:hypothetical protein
VSLVRYLLHLFQANYCIKYLPNLKVLIPLLVWTKKKTTHMRGLFLGRRGGIRTRKPVRAADFKSAVYTIPPPARVILGLIIQGSYRDRKTRIGFRWA